MIEFINCEVNNITLITRNTQTTPNTIKSYSGILYGEFKSDCVIYINNCKISLINNITADINGIIVGKINGPISNYININCLGIQIQDLIELNNIKLFGEINNNHQIILKNIKVFNNNTEIDNISLLDNRAINNINKQSCNITF
jgi:hypothetical protein